MVVRVAIEYGVVMGLSILIALLYRLAAGAAFIPALLVGLGLAIGVTVVAELSRRRQMLQTPTVILLVLTFVALLAWMRLG